MDALLVTIGFLVALASLLFVNQATLGVWLIGISCFLGILARIAQASSSHNEIVSIWKSLLKPTKSDKSSQ